MQRSVIFSLLIAILLQVCGRSWVVVYYEWNKTYIANNLCENRDKPALKCHGKCKLMKMMEKEKQKERHPLGNVFEKSTDLICDIREIKIISVPYTLVLPNFVKHQFYYHNPVTKGANRACFHPPSLA